MRNKGFTLIELVIAVTIIIILAGSVLAGIGPVMRTLRFGNTFNKMVFMVQQARSSAAVSKGDSDYYGVEFGSPDNKSLCRFEGKTADPQPTCIENYVMAESANTDILIKKNPGELECGTGSIRFAKKTAAVSFYCNGQAEDDIVFMEFGLTTKPDVTDFEKSFTIHKQAGIPQIKQY